MNLQADAAQRLTTYRRLEARNRIVSILRIGVPLLGVVALSALLLQILVSSSMSRFGISTIAVSSESVIVETPQYSGLLDDGTAYRVSATQAEAAVDATDKIALSNASLVMTRPSGVVTEVDAAGAILYTTDQRVEIPEMARVTDSDGTIAALEDSVFDYHHQRLVGRGPVRVDYRDGTTIRAEGLDYDAAAAVWTFRRATVTLPDTPGANQPASATP
jgi:lipopolysaccharide export system protein LptC